MVQLVFPDIKRVISGKFEGKYESKEDIKQSDQAKYSSIVKCQLL